jgi:hypothetical protein
MYTVYLMIIIILGICMHLKQNISQTDVYIQNGIYSCNTCTATFECYLNITNHYRKSSVDLKSTESN